MTFVPYQQQGSNVGPMGTIRSGNGHVTGGVPFIAHTASTLKAKAGWRGDEEDVDNLQVAHTLTTEYDASEDGSGRGTPIVSALTATGIRTADDNQAQARHLVPYALQDVRETDKKDMNGLGVSQDDVMYSLTTMDRHGVAVPIALAENQRGELRTMDVAPALGAGGGKPGQGYPAVAVALRGREGGNMPETSEVMPAMRSGQGGSDKPMVLSHQVRRLLPIETERLQGLPDGWTATGANGEAISDAARYAMVGNAVAVPVVEWIAQRMVR
jgi:DNA (cytosine-5)-methyltransferase 1